MVDAAFLGKHDLLLVELASDFYSLIEELDEMVLLLLLVDEIQSLFLLYCQNLFNLFLLSSMLKFLLAGLVVQVDF